MIIKVTTKQKDILEKVSAKLDEANRVYRQLPHSLQNKLNRLHNVGITFLINNVSNVAEEVWKEVRIDDETPDYKDE